MTIRELRDHDAEAIVDLRKKALVDAPLSFAASPGDDFASEAEAVRRELRRAPDWVIIGAFREDREGLVGMVGLFRDRHLKAAHKAHIWGMYVRPECRGVGVAAGLLEAALAHARSLPGVSQVHLCVTSAAPEAQRLYQRAGFRVWGTEPDALRYLDQAVVDHHMVLRFDPTS